MQNVNDLSAGTLAFVGDVIQDTSEKICDALDESVERIQD